MERSSERLFEILVHEHELALHAFVRSCVQQGTAADDIVQEVFVAAWRNLAEYDQTYPFARWLPGIAKNKILEFHRNRKTRLRHVSTLSPEQIDVLAGEFDRLIPGRGDAAAETLAALRDCLAALPPRERHLIHAVYRERQTCAAIAERLEETAEGVKKRLQRIRAQLRDCILGKLAKEAIHV
ncbi:MAG TPA: sigma-70 family RNA polymerase sigma factor [Phycisphaerae bacterium]|nr:sigma-70 family RNA polymerase sigma factor [Phycisphaerae bacterium]